MELLVLLVFQTGNQLCPLDQQTTEGQLARGDTAKLLIIC